MASVQPPFNPKLFLERITAGHNARLGVRYRSHGPDWCDLILPYSPALIGDEARAIVASGPIIALLDMATSIGVWLKRGEFVPHATLELRIDYLRPAAAGRDIIGHGECYRLTRSIAFVRGIAHDGDADDPVAHVAGTFMTTGAAP